MKHDYTHLIIVLDASGSMSSIQDDIKGSFNEFLKKQPGFYQKIDHRTLVAAREPQQLIGHAGDHRDQQNPDHDPPDRIRCSDKQEKDHTHYHYDQQKTGSASLMLT